MDNDQRDRRGWPESDSTSEPAGGEQPPADGASSVDEPVIDIASDPTPDVVAPPEPVPPDWGAPDPPAADASVSAAEIESWPSQDATAEGPADPDGTRAWPTEPPEAGASSEEAWPTSAPERGDQPVLAPDDTAEPPPSEVEAYPASPTASETEPAVPPLPESAAALGANTVPDAAGATGESTLCPRCGTENRPGLAFCHSCGQRLVAAGVATTVERPGTPEGTQACPRCGTHNRSGVAFCQNCGANLRGTAPGYVPPSVASEEAAVPAAAARGGAVLGPVVLIIGIIGLVTGYLLPFLYGSGSLFERAFGSGGYGATFWSDYPQVNAAVADQAYFGLAAPVPILALLLAVLAVAGFMRARPGTLQTVGLVIALVWSVALVVLFLVVEVGGNWGGDLVGVLRELTAGGIILFLSSLITMIGTLTRFGRS